jgi:hypothetical protein
VWLEGRSTATRKINLMPKHNREFVKHIPEALFYSCVARVSWASPTLDGEPHCDSTVPWMVPVLGQYLKNAKSKRIGPAINNQTLFVGSLFLQRQLGRVPRLLTERLLKNKNKLNLQARKLAIELHPQRASPLTFATRFDETNGHDFAIFTSSISELPILSRDPSLQVLCDFVGRSWNNFQV